MTTTIMIDEAQRNWLERLKRKHNLKSLNEAIKKIRGVFNKLKLEDELE